MIQIYEANSRKQNPQSTLSEKPRLSVPEQPIVDVSAAVYSRDSSPEHNETISNSKLGESFKKPS